MTPQTQRSGADRCPGALKPFAAHDGNIVRVRIPGGEVSLAVLQTLMSLAQQYGVPQLQLTVRANLQLRGLPDPLPDGFVGALEEAGVLPSRTHERARNILAAPTSARQRARARELDEQLRLRPALAQLPGRFLMLCTDTGGLGLSEPYDLAFVDGGSGDGLLLAHGKGRRCSADSASSEMLDIAENFLSARTDERVWNLRELPEDTAVLDGFEPVNPPAGASLSPGAIGRDLVLGVSEGLLRAEHLAALAALTDTVVLSPWRCIVLLDGAPNAAVLAEAGFVCR